MNFVKNSLLLVSLIISISGCRIPYTMHPEMANSGPEEVSSKRCRECHTVIYDEWSNSTHSKAYSNQFFKDLTNDYQIKACLKCHTPESAFASQLQLRNTFTKEGVHCQSCHLYNGRLQGPTDQHLPFDIHPIQEKNVFYLKSDLCGCCHKKTFAEYSASAITEKTCQDCHMPTVTRTIIDNRPWVWAKKKFKFRRHSFDIEVNNKITGELKLSLNLQTQNPPTGQIIINNVSIPHNVPSGAYGYHVLLLTLNLLDDAGETEEKKSIYFTQELKTSIKPGERRVINFEFEDEHQFPWGVQATLSKDSLTPAKIKVLAEAVEYYQ